MKIVESNNIELLEAASVYISKKKRNPDAAGMSGVVSCVLYVVAQVPRLPASPT